MGYEAMKQPTSTELNTKNAGAWASQYYPNIIPEPPKWMLEALAKIEDRPTVQIEIAKRTIEEWHSPIGIASRSTGFNPYTFLPTKGPEHDRHHTQLLQAVCKTSGLSMHDIMNELTELSISGTLPRNNFAHTVDLLRVFGLPHRCIPQGWKLRRAMNHILSGYFGEEPRKKILSTMLMWTLAIHNPFKNRRRYTTAEHTSFDLLNQVIESLGTHAQATEDGIIVYGKSGEIYDIHPMQRAPRYRVKAATQAEPPGVGLCLPPELGTEELPLGDHLCGLVLGLRNDIATSRRIELLRMFLAPRLHRLYTSKIDRRARELIEDARRRRRAIDSEGEEE